MKASPVSSWAKQAMQQVLQEEQNEANVAPGVK
jgi:hypothetical protein